MKIRTVLSFLLGAVLVLGVAAAGLVHAYRQAHVLPAAQAVVVADETSVGAGFAGYVQEIYVRPGDQVEVGDELLRLQSPTLEQARRTTDFNEEGVGYRLEGDDVMVFLATGAGTVGPMPQGAGSFIPANTEITRIELADTTHVQSRLQMTAGDFARLSRDATVRVTLPGGEEVVTQVTDVFFDQEESGEVTLRSTSDELRADAALINNSPVSAEVELSDGGGIGSWSARQVGSLFTPRGY